MDNYLVYLSELTETDIQDLADVIMYKYKAPTTSLKYIQELLNEIKKLQHSAETTSIQTRKSLAHYGANVRRANYKKMAIIYTVHQGTVYIHRLVAANMIAGL